MPSGHFNLKVAVSGVKSTYGPELCDNFDHSVLSVADPDEPPNTHLCKTRLIGFGGGVCQRQTYPSPASRDRAETVLRHQGQKLEGGAAGGAARLAPTGSPDPWSRSGGARTPPGLRSRATGARGSSRAACPPWASGRRSQHAPPLARHGRTYPDLFRVSGHPRRVAAQADMDARIKSGHDEVRGNGGGGGATFLPRARPFALGQPRDRFLISSCPDFSRCLAGRNPITNRNH